MKKTTKKNDQKSPSSPPNTPQELLSALKRLNKPQRIDDLLRAFRLPRRGKKLLEHMLDELVAEKKLLRLTGGGYYPADGLKQQKGTLQIQRSGVGFVIPEGTIGNDIFIAPHSLGDALHGDVVSVTLLPGSSRGKSREGKITAVLERAATELSVRAFRRTDDDQWLCEPTDTRINAIFLTDCSTLPQNLKVDDLVRVKPEGMTAPGMWKASALEMLGEETNVRVQEQLVKGSHGVPQFFPPSVAAQAQGMAQNPGPEDIANRRDLRNTSFVTIDGETAKDFDDAIFVAQQGAGYQLLVAIADVAHYVPQDSFLDKEALIRGNSYYFPLSVEPMLPEHLSNGLCSLNPDVPRLVMVAEIFFDAFGRPGKTDFYPAVIQSKARLTYTQVNRALIDKNENTRAELAQMSGGLLSMLETAEKLARLLTQQRRDRGNLDFELPEAEFRFDDQDHVIDIVPRINLFAHKLIEEFMVAANEAVARFLTAHKKPVLYRSHPEPEPEKLRTLFAALAKSDLGRSDAAKDLLAAFSRKSAKTDDTGVSPKLLQKLLFAAKGTPQEFLVSRLTLRTMMQAAYTPEHEPHFGLASDCYCHFTSPIRRYADLVVHRSLKNALGGDTPSPRVTSLQNVADAINATERTAVEAERDITKRLTVLFMMDKVGQEFTGIISGITDFGFFIALEGVMAEGMVVLSSMRDDYYIFTPETQELRGERTGRLFRLGQRVEVRLAEVSLPRLEITLELAGADDAPARGRLTASTARPKKRITEAAPARKSGPKKSRKKTK